MDGAAPVRRAVWWLLVIAAALVGIALTDPATSIGRFVGFAFAGALAAATQDIAINGWRIDVADEAAPIELLSAVYQFGYRSASIVGGATRWRQRPARWTRAVGKPLSIRPMSAIRPR